MKTFGPRFITVIFTLFCFVFTPKPSGAQEVPLKFQAAIFFKVLSYDNSIKNKKNDIVISLIIDKKNASKKSSLFSIFNTLKGKSIFQKKIIVNIIEISSSNQLEGQIIAKKSDVLYVSDGADKDIVNKIVSIANRTKKITLGGNEQLAQMGFAVCLTLEKGMPKIVINLKASQNQGMQLSSKVLRLAKLTN